MNLPCLNKITTTTTTTKLESLCRFLGEFHEKQPRSQGSQIREHRSDVAWETFYNHLYFEIYLLLPPGASRFVITFPTMFRSTFRLF